jgi:ABC-type glycerol-3-phosphate transport system substrate-binding protein
MKPGRLAAALLVATLVAAGIGAGEAGATDAVPSVDTVAWWARDTLTATPPVASGSG